MVGSQQNSRWLCSRGFSTLCAVQGLGFRADKLFREAKEHLPPYGLGFRV